MNHLLLLVCTGSINETEAALLSTDLIKVSLVVISKLLAFGGSGNCARTTFFRMFFCLDTSSSVLSLEELEENDFFFRLLLDFLNFSSSSTSVINSASFAFAAATSYVANDKKNILLVNL